MKVYFHKKLGLHAITASILLASCAILLSCGDEDLQGETQFSTLVIEDEFDSPNGLDASFWSLDIGTGQNGWGNNELQYYTDQAENIKLEDGMLHIIAQKENLQGSAYTSAKIVSKGKFDQAYGRFEARIKLPWGQGIWPAFWLLGDNIDEVGWPKCGEIDIMEYRGQNPTIIHGTVHGPGYSGGQSVGKSFDLVGSRFDADFHIFAIEWEPELIKFYVDDILYNQITPDDVSGDWVFDHPFYIILNVAVGGSFVGPPNSGTVFPQTMLVDYVKVYQ